MSSQTTLLLMTATLGLTACASSEDTLAFGDAVSFAPDDNILTLSAESGDVALPLDPAFDRGTFVGAELTTSAQRQRLIALSETDDTFAALLIDRNTDGSAETFVGRSAGTVALPLGKAEVTGTYVGSFTSGDLETYITGDTALSLDFDEKKLSGTITDRTAVQTTGTATTAEPFDLPSDVAFNDIDIAANGRFSGAASTSEGDTTMIQTGRVEGFFGGENGSEIVGRIALTEDTSNPLVTRPAEVGVFAVGHAE